MECGSRLIRIHKPAKQKKEMRKEGKKQKKT